MKFPLKPNLGAENRGGKSFRKIIGDKWTSLADAQLVMESGVNLFIRTLLLHEEGSTQWKPNLSRSDRSACSGKRRHCLTSNMPPTNPIFPLWDICIGYPPCGQPKKKKIPFPHPQFFVYSSSPLAYSFKRKRSAKQVVWLRLSPEKPVNYKPFRSNPAGIVSGKFDNLPETWKWLEEILLLRKNWRPMKPTYAIWLLRTGKRFQKKHNDGIVNLDPPKLKGISTTENNRLQVEGRLLKVWLVSFSFSTKAKRRQRTECRDFKNYFRK